MQTKPVFNRSAIGGALASTKTGLNIVVMGFADHGKDEFCKHLGVAYGSSSETANRLFMYFALKDKYGYKTPEECLLDRGNHRHEWFELIRSFNRFDKARLLRAVFSKHQIYCGLRCREEFYAGRDAGLFDLAIWVDRSEHVPPESRDSITVTKADADFVVDNNGTKVELRDKAINFSRALLDQRLIA